MRSTLLVAAVATALTVDLSTVSAQLPIPSKPDGYTYMNGSLAAPVQIDVFEDTMCPFCKVRIVVSEVARINAAPLWA